MDVEPILNYHNKWIVSFAAAKKSAHELMPGRTNQPVEKTTKRA